MRVLIVLVAVVIAAASALFLQASRIKELQQSNVYLLDELSASHARSQHYIDALLSQQRYGAYQLPDTLVVFDQFERPLSVTQIVRSGNKDVLLIFPEDFCPSCFEQCLREVRPQLNKCAARLVILAPKRRMREVATLLSLDNMAHTMYAYENDPDFGPDDSMFPYIAPITQGLECTGVYTLRSSTCAIVLRFLQSLSGLAPNAIRLDGPL